MLPLTEGRALRIRPDGKRPHPQTPSESSGEASPTPHQEEEDDLVNNYTLDPIVDIDQIPPIKGANSTQPIETSPLAPRALIFSTPPSLPIELHPYLTSMEDLPPRSSNPPPPLASQGFTQTLP
ncbi:hypothetical protein Tco_0525720 [Tanacetum coccineum]